MNTQILYPLKVQLLFERGNEISTKLGRGAIFFKKNCMETKRGKAEEMQRSQGDVMRLLAMMVTNTNTSLENLFLQKCSLLLLIIGRIIQTS